MVARSFQWNGGNGGFATAGQWTDLTDIPAQPGPPATTDIALLANAGTISGTGTVDQLRVTSAITVSGTLAAAGAAGVALQTGALTLAAGAELDTTSIVSGNAATLNVMGGTLSASALGNAIALGGGNLFDAAAVRSLGLFALGNANNGQSGGTGVLTVQNGATVSTATTTLGGAIGAPSTGGNSGTLTLTGAQTRWANASISDALYVGALGTGAVTIAAGAQLTDFGVAHIGYGGIGSLLADGAGSAWVNAQLLDIGNNAAGAVTLRNGATASAATLILGSHAAGTLTVQSGATMTTSGISVGTAAGATGTITVAGGTLNDFNFLTVGVNGRGGVAVQAGGTLNSTDAEFGLNAGAIGTMSVSGAGARWSSSLGITVGSGGAGTLTIGAGGTVTDLVGEVGGAASGSGTVVVAGAGATWSNSNWVLLGNAGTATATIAAGGTISVALYSKIGQQALSHGGMLVTGAGSRWSTVGNLAVGDAGSGTLTVQSGAATTVQGSLDIGAQATGLGRLQLDGAGATLSSAGPIMVGNAGTGDLILSNAATETTAGTLIVASQSGADGTLELRDAGSKLLVTGDLVTAGGGSGTLTAGSGTTLTTTGALSGGVDNGSAGTAALSGATLTVGTDLLIGGSGSWAATLAQGTQATAAGTVDIGVNSIGAGSLTVTDAGTLLRTSAFGLIVGDAGSGTLAVLNGAAVSGNQGTLTIGANAGATGVMTVAGGSAVTQFAAVAVGGALGGAGTLSVITGGGLAATALSATTSGTIVLTDGTLQTGTFGLQGVLSGRGIVGGAIADDGVISALGGVLVLTGPISGGGQLSIGANATLSAGGALASGLQVVFAGGTNDLLRLGSPDQVAAPLSGFVTSDTIELQGFAASTANWNNGTLALLGAGGAHLSLHVTGSYRPTQFNLASDGSGGTNVTLACFAAGTHILTSTGEINVEALRVGDTLPTLRGQRVARIKWLGHRRVQASKNQKINAVQIETGAFSDGVPHRALTLSPDHAVWTGGALIPARLLVDNRSIHAIEVDEIIYWHVELERHDVVVCEGLPTESYLDTGNRADFANAGTVIALQPEFPSRTWDNNACGLLTLGGPLLAEIRERLAARYCLRPAGAVRRQRRHS